MDFSIVGAIRGGNSFAGSRVWADIREYDDVEGCFTQVFGHTAQKNTTDGTWDGPYSVGNNICVDCGECFYLDDEGLLRFFWMPTELLGYGCISLMDHYSRHIGNIVAPKR